MNTRDIESDEQFTQINDVAKVWNTARLPGDREQLSQEKTRHCSDGDEEGCAVWRSRLPSGGDIQLTPSSGEEEKNLILLEMEHWKIYDDERFQAAQSIQPQDGLRARMEVEASVLQPLEIVSQSTGLQENPEKSPTAGWLKGIYTLHEMQVVQMNSVKEALNEETRSADKKQDVFSIKVAVPLYYGSCVLCKAKAVMLGPPVK